VRTFSPKPSDITRKWLVIDASGMTLGRLSTEVALRLRGKHKPIFATHMDCGDHVIVVNADKIHLDQKKAAEKMHHHYSGYPGGMRSTSYAVLLATKPEEMLRLAVRGMLPKNSLGRQMIRKLKVYSGPTHPHEAQMPVALDLPDARRAVVSN
jgi:large subunit ribosomal protein L13